MSTDLRPAPGTTDVGADAYALMERLYPLCRSLTGAGVRSTFDLIAEEIPITTTDVPSGSGVLDWIVPDEWNLRDPDHTHPDATRLIH